jgi:signal transduction histidine kinase
MPRGWLAIALTLLAGSQLHNAVWPSTFASVLTSASILQLGCSILLVVGGMLEFRRIAISHEAVIVTERELVSRQSELASLRADFTSMVSHEIGSPLAAIRAYADILDEEQLDPAIRRKAVATIRDQVDHLRNLVDDIATIESIESDNFDVRPFSLPLNLILADAAAFAASLPGGHPFSCSLRSRERVVVDPVRISQVLRNLLDNAAKYSPSGTPIELRAERVGEQVRMEVVDCGDGIPANCQERIFEKFGRGEAAQNGTVAGTGLGLYISRRIVEAHGSHLTVSSTPGDGSVFAFELQVAM